MLDACQRRGSSARHSCRFLLRICTQDRRKAPEGAIGAWVAHEVLHAARTHRLVVANPHVVVIEATGAIAVESLSALGCLSEAARAHLPMDPGSSRPTQLVIMLASVLFFMLPSSTMTVGTSDMLSVPRSHLVTIPFVA